MSPELKVLVVLTFCIGSFGTILVYSVEMRNIRERAVGLGVTVRAFARASLGAVLGEHANKRLLAAVVAPMLAV